MPIPDNLNGVALASSPCSVHRLEADATAMVQSLLRKGITMKLHRLIYASDQHEHIELADLKEILAKSERNNAELEITGLLLMVDRKFLQVLEGPGAELNTLYEKIMKDSRHKNIQLISYTPIHDRHFKEWSMKGINWSFIKPDIQSFLYKKYGESEKAVTVPDDPWLAYSLLYDVYCNIHHGLWE